MSLPKNDPAREQISGRLQDAIVGVREQLRRVELWAAALDGFSRPVASAEPPTAYRLPVRSRRSDLEPSR